MEQSASATSFEPYLSFYGEHKISPVRQDISNVLKHFERRDYLYRFLGIAPFAIAGKAVAEFGPGSGYNALYTTHLAPSRYLLVDGNPTGLNEAQELLRRHFPHYSGHEFVLSRIQDFKRAEKFDVVFCEGVIPHQREPGAFTSHVGSFVKPGGVLAITTADYVSVFPEALRRVICDTIVPHDAPLAEKIAKLVPVFKSHYASLPGASRPIEDWLVDTLLDTWGNPLFSFEDAVRALDGEFEVYGSSPKFMTDWRWYKDLNASTADLNQRSIAQYQQTALSLMDCRTDIPTQAKEIVATTRELCEQAYWAMIAIRNSTHPDFAEVIELCQRLQRITAATMPNISEPVSEVAAYLRSYRTIDPISHFQSFRSFFGRGQQYVSFIRRSKVAAE